MKYALITGASGGIGYELAKIFAKNNINVVLVARSEQKLMNLAKLLEEKNKIKTIVITKDLSLNDAALEVYNELKEKNIHVEYLINNAGFGIWGKFHETEWEGEKEMLNLNIIALTQFTKLFVKDMVKNGSGRIMNLGSNASFQPTPLLSMYAATKAYVLSFSEGIANELQGTGVSVTVLCPGATKTGFQEKADVQESNIVKGKKLPTAKSVANFGYKVMMKGKTTKMHGIKNRFLTFLVRFAPRKVVPKISRKFMEK
ncbi:SDR family NAD(P)-dependent oxidoreductase [Promethearchaeum syntrophicum]|uniref:SDR family NAD(P)-dependent oxidoreductase n=1 Tax=Promethearchaeum syntrophicum TaxID=2594042 RepID=A0A5B9DCB2_9ARCH|nr:SDR family oxidoreductase [Candidatus Prometheoarchaeum syntrophicum]QEE16681.1 short chain dehydrogenase [Candidatus Prometheoarchaeum syntrophicum]